MSQAFVLINCDLGSENQVVDQLETISGVKEILKTYGIYDLVAKLEAKSDKDIVETSSKIRNIGPVRLVLTLDTSP